jgi:hypothetical protein
MEPLEAPEAALDSWPPHSKSNSSTVASGAAAHVAAAADTGQAMSHPPLSIAEGAAAAAATADKEAVDMEAAAAAAAAEAEVAQAAQAAEATEAAAMRAQNAAHVSEGV